MTEPFVSVQVINWNGLKFLKDCFDSLLRQDYSNLELVLVDNGSTDRSVSFIKSNYSREIKKGIIRIDELGKNYGFAGGYNRSYAHTTADYVLLINNDTICPDNQLISKLICKAESDSKIALVGASIFTIGTNSKKIQKRKRPVTLSIVLTNTLRRLKNNNVLYVSGCCCLIRKDLIDIPFDEDYFAYCEDVYLGWYSLIKGYSNVLEPDAKLLHYGSGTSGSGSPFVRYYAERNRMLNCLLFYKSSTLLKILPLLALYSIFTGIFLLQRPKVFWSFFKGHLWILSHPITILRKRKQIQTSRVINDQKIVAILSSEIFLTNAKNTSFYKTLKNKKGIMILIDSFSKFLNKLSGGYCRLVGLKTIDNH